MTMSDMMLIMMVMKMLRGRDAKCHGYDGLIRVKILASWGKSFGEQMLMILSM